MNSSHTSLALCVLLLAVIGSALSSENQDAGEHARSAQETEEVSASGDDQEVAAVDDTTVEEATKDVTAWASHASISPQTP